MQKTILVVDDQPTIGEGIQQSLLLEGFNVHLARDGVDALDWLTFHTPHLIITDIVMPRMSGYQLHERIRSNPDWLRIPFIFLTGKSDAEDIRFGKELGVDDYLTKPIALEDLLAAVHGRLRRYEQMASYIHGGGSGNGSNGYKPVVGCYELEGLLIDMARREITAQGDVIDLSPTEFDVLQRLIVASGGVVEHDVLLGYDDEHLAGDAAELLRYHIRNLRNKLRAGGHSPDLIENVRGVGYRLSARPRRVIV